VFITLIYKFNERYKENYLNLTALFAIVRPNWYSANYLAFWSSKSVLQEYPNLS